LAVNFERNVKNKVDKFYQQIYLFLTLAFYEYEMRCKQMQLLCEKPDNWIVFCKTLFVPTYLNKKSQYLS